MIDERITIVQLARFGDIIQTSPLVQNLKLQHGYSRELTLVVDKRSEEAARVLYGVDRVIGVDIEAAASIRTHGVVPDLKLLKEWVRSWKPDGMADRLILLNQGNLASAIASLISAGKVEGPLFGRSLPRPHRYLNAALKDRRFNPLHLCEIWAAYGPKILPLQQPKIREEFLGMAFALYSSDGCVSTNKNKYIAINLGAGAAGRCLRWEKLAALASTLLKESGVRVVLLGTEEDVEAGEKVAGSVHESTRKHIRNLAGRTKVSDLPGILEQCALLISSDTGTLQLAAGTSAGTLGLFFGGANPCETGAYADGAVAIVDRKTLTAKLDDEVMNNDDPFDPDHVAQVALDMVRKGQVEKLKDENAGVSLLVAGSTSVGIEYESFFDGEPWSMDSGRRWRAFARALLWHEEMQHEPEGLEWKRSSRFGPAGSGVTGDFIAKAAGPSGFRISQLNSRWISAEERWLEGLLQAFPEGEALLGRCVHSGAPEGS